MSLGFEARVTCKPLNNCFISLPASFIYPLLDSTSLLVQQIIIRISKPKNNEHVVTIGWNGTATSESDSIEIDAQYAQLLNIKDKSILHVELDLQTLKQETIITAASVEIEPVSMSDWELTEIYAQEIESNFLSQVRCVTKDQLLLVRTHPLLSTSDSSNCVTFRVKNIKSLLSDVNFATLSNATELYIIPKPYNDQTKANNVSKDNPSAHRKKRSVSSRRTNAKVDGVIRRSLILKEGNGIFLSSKDNNSNIFRNIDYALITVIEGPGTPPGARKTSAKELELGVPQKCFGRTLVAKYVPTAISEEMEENTEIDDMSVFLSPLLAVALGLENCTGELVHIEPYNRKCIKLDLKNCELLIHKLVTNVESRNNHTEDGKLELQYVSSLEKKRKDSEKKKMHEKTLKQVLADLLDPSSPISNGMKLPVIPAILPEGGILEIVGETSERINKKNSLLNSWVCLGMAENAESADDWKSYLDSTLRVTLGNDILVPSSRIQRKQISLNEVKMYAQDKKVSLLRKLLSNGIPTFLYGKSGSGKTTICSVLQTQFKEEGYYVKSVNFDEVGTAADKQDESAVMDEEEEEFASKEKESNKNKFLADYFERIVVESAWRAPALVILENLDTVIPKEVEHGDSGASLQLTELLIKAFSKAIEENKIRVLITAKSKDSINGTIFQSHFVDEEVNLEPPNKTQIVEILGRLINDKFSKYQDTNLQQYLPDVASDLDGYLPIDLEILLDRAFHYMVTDGKLKIEHEHFISALDGYTPTSLRGVKLQKSTTAWSDIGGLIEVKRIMLETLEWPTKYAPIFEKCSLRLRSGILLYGYPGCGKTMLASAISSQCGLNFISVKGPEILNKYIGASEQSIRELFERAQSAKPCILFFDEFDSIAPKRGHDSTGVTDRIVNQLLTQMDGAEGLEGVYVLAATSRPDLIDSALLRPGRLDKSVICDLPDFENRLDILHTIVKSNGFCVVNETTSLEQVAEKTDGYTGADLQAVVYNAYLKGVHKNLESVEETPAEPLTGTEFTTFMGKFASDKTHSKVNGKRIETLIASYDSQNMNFVSQATSTNKMNGEKHETKTIYIEFQHLLDSLAETKRSISAKELEKLEGIYAKFENSKRTGEMKDGGGSTDVGVRATLM